MCNIYIVLIEIPQMPDKAMKRQRACEVVNDVANGVVNGVNGVNGAGYHHLNQNGNGHLRNGVTNKFLVATRNGFVNNVRILYLSIITHCLVLKVFRNVRK